MGPYDNERGVHVESPEVAEGQWLEHEDGRLYIVTKGGDGVEGPDDELCDLIIQTRGGKDRLSDQDIEALSLTEVGDVLKRFDPGIGYYHA